MLENMKIKNTTVCDCGREFTITDIKKLERVDDKSFYSGVVKHYSKATCPNCGKEVILLLKQVGQTYKVLNIAEIETIEEKAERDEKSVENMVENIENSYIDTTIENKEEKQESNELICPVCKKECKNKTGLTSHMKTHETN